jgi:hypothetical protein
MARHPGVLFGQGWHGRFVVTVHRFRCGRWQFRFEGERTVCFGLN